MSQVRNLPRMWLLKMERIQSNKVTEFLPLRDFIAKRLGEHVDDEKLKSYLFVLIKEYKLLRDKENSSDALHEIEFMFGDILKQCIEQRRPENGRPVHILGVTASLFEIYTRIWQSTTLSTDMKIDRAKQILINERSPIMTLHFRKKEEVPI